MVGLDFMGLYGANIPHSATGQTFGDAIANIPNMEELEGRAFRVQYTSRELRSLSATCCVFLGLGRGGPQWDSDNL